MTLLLIVTLRSQLKSQLVITLYAEVIIPTQVKMTLNPAYAALLYHELLCYFLTYCFESTFAPFRNYVRTYVYIASYVHM